jgi:1-phosphatidylinositol-4-phosphate 5-kinase
VLKDELKFPSGESVSVEVMAPRVFEKIRSMEDISPQMFSAQWELPPDQCSLAEGGGRSMALFLQSLNGTFLMKTIAEVEAKVLLQTLPQYVSYLDANNDSFLMRYVMLLKVVVENGPTGYVVVFVNVFDEGHSLIEKWDIKGRYPKPTKYEEAVAEYTGTINSVKVPVRKDKHLQRAFFIRHEIRNVVVAQLLNDFKFLESENLMDYSILIGVQKIDNINSFPFLSPVQPSSTEFQLERDSSVITPVSPAGEQRGGRALLRKALSQYHGGIPSLDYTELFFIGVIDALTFYNGKKKSANFFKTFLWAEETLSTVPAKSYGKRISDFAKIIFPDPKPEWKYVEQALMRNSVAAPPLR